MTLVTWEMAVADFPANDYLNEFLYGKNMSQVMDSDYFLMLIVINKNHFQSFRSY